MITSEYVLEWLKTLPVKPQQYYCGKLDTKKDKSFGIYNLNYGRRNETCIGGKETTKTGTHGVSILVHWNKSTRETQNTAVALYEAIEQAKDIVIGGHEVNYIQMPYNAPIDVGSDDNGICEYVIEFIVYYER